jgi:hypothetical protein
MDHRLTTNLSDDLRRAIEHERGGPLLVVDAATNVHYVLVRADLYEEIKGDSGALDVEAIYPLLAEIEPDDWEDVANYPEKP